MKILPIVLVSLMTLATVSFAQDATQSPPRRQSPAPTIRCEEMNKLVKQIQDHRQSCEVCKTNLISRVREKQGQPRPK
jgi:hypothetical protein